MDVIEEDCEQNSEIIFEVPTVDFDGLDLYTGNPMEDSNHSESSSEISDSETDFAKQLRRQRKQVLEERAGRPAKAQDFSQILRQHRDVLVETWGDHHPQQHPSPQKAEEAAMTESNNNQEDDDLFGDWNQIQTSTSLERDNDDNGDMIVSALSNETPVSALSAASGGVVQEALSFENLEQNLSMDSTDLQTTDIELPPGTPSRVLDDLLAVMSNDSDVESSDGGPLMPDVDPTNGNALAEADAKAMMPETNGHGTSVPASSSHDDLGFLGMVGSSDLPVSEDPVCDPSPSAEELDFFGGFAGTSHAVDDTEGSPSKFEPQASADIDIAPQPSMESSPDDADGFGDFGAAAEPQTNSSEDADEFGDFATPSQAVSNVGKSSSKDDDDFAEAKSEEAPAPPPGGDELPCETDDTLASQDEFGGFDAATPQPELGLDDVEPQTRTSASTDDDDDDDDNGFENFGSAPKQGHEPGSEGDNGDFGGFDSAPSEQRALSSDENDFDKALSHSQLPASKTNDDDFGDFDTAQSRPEASPANHDDALGGFDAVPSEAQAPVSTEDNDFGDFGEAPPETQAPSSTIDGDEFGDFDAAPSQTAPTDDNDFGGFDEAPSQAQVAASAAEDDDFGDFDAAPSDALAPASKDDDDFGDFDAAPSQAAPTDSIDFGGFDEAPSQAQGAASAAEDDDFGDFDAATSEAQPPASKDDDAFGDFGEAPSQKVAPTSTEDDDDFGDFDAAPSQAAPTYDNDFGGFDEAPSRAQVAPSAADDDDFGDFGAAPSEAQAPAAKEDDAFGDFGEAPSQPVAPASIEDDDDFGDFDAAPSQQLATATDDDNDFGDFDTAQPQAPTSTENDDFGDFGDAPAAPAPAPAVALPSGPSFEAARTLLGRLQTNFQFAEIESVDEEAAPKASLGDFIKPEAEDFAKELSGSATLIQWLEELGTRTHGSSTVSKRIIENDGRGPFAHFAFPVGGLPSADEEMERYIRARRVSVLTTRIPDVLPIQLPTGDEVPLDVASPKSKRKDGPIEPSLNGLSELQIPNLSEIKAKNSGSTQSPAVKELLSKIPDLSFMLESKLVLPKK